MPKKTRTKVQTVTCRKCKEEIYSRTQHDFHRCSCGGVAVDGGLRYIRYLWTLGDAPPSIKTRFIAATAEELYRDWNERQSRFGIIPKKGAK